VQRGWVRAVTTLTTVLIMAVIFLFSMQPAVDSDRTSGVISLQVARLIRPEFDSLPEDEKTDYFNRVQTVVRKCAHFLEYWALGLSLRLCLESWLFRRRRLGWAAWLGGAAWAVIDEIHQTIVDGRAGQLPDVALDGFGVLCGVLLGTWLILRFMDPGRSSKPRRRKDG